ncbi:hypothetical protein VTK26DRAFT_6096 [Humicola hyalothermophila]
MKFAKELERDAVPEWRAKYLNYKVGKKHIKAVTRAISRATTTPNLGRRSDASPLPHHTPANFGGANHHNSTFPHPVRSTASLTSDPGDGPDTFLPKLATSTGIRADATSGDERSGLAHTSGSAIHYGSFGASSTLVGKRSFELPDPAIGFPSSIGDHRPPSPSLQRSALQRSASMRAAALPPGDNHSPPQFTLHAGDAATTPRMRVARLFSSGHGLTRHTAHRFEIGMQDMDWVRATEREFFCFLDSELDKIETFYKEKEDQATERLAALRAQLHEMRNRRTAEIAEARRRREMAASGGGRKSDDEGQGRAKDRPLDWVSPIKDRFLKPGPNSKALQRMVQTPVMAGLATEQGRDYVRRAPPDGVPYRTAKRKLKLAMQEFYRGLELLKSYAVLNRTAFRKLNKKYDKAVHARPPYRYMNEKVNKSWFVNSDIIDGHIRVVEDLYARYFEKGNHKIAAGKLRNLQKRPGDSFDSAFRSGLLIGIGAVFAVHGLVYASRFLSDNYDGDGDKEDLAERTSYLLQLYGGYFLALLMFVLFTLDCRVWTKNKVNYPFIFEFDPRSVLDWKQLAEFPSFFFALFGVFIWLNFSNLSNLKDMYLYYPVLLVCISVLVLFFPGPVLHHKSRKWFLYSHYRLLLSGLYPVEFRDFFLGDIWCSLTYATCNVELFFCLYAHSWDNPEECNSSHSRLLGFLGALPPIWRALQCIRRYHDTRHVFPHLVNCGKYTMTIITAVLLSLYRISGTKTNLSFYIAFAAINAVYCSIWDLFMDFSLLQANAGQRLLRDFTALRPVWIYYFMMIVDPILRFSWIFYAIFTHNTQHSNIVSFLVSLSEVIRRGLWALLRVENEHCSNVAQYKAARDTPLPYNLVQQLSLEAAPHSTTSHADLSTTLTFPPPSTCGPQQPHEPPPIPISIPHSQAPNAEMAAAAAAGAPSSAGAHALAMEEGATEFSHRRPSMPPHDHHADTFRRHRRTDTPGKRSILQAMAEAHKQDFEKRRVPVDDADLDLDEGADADADVDGLKSDSEDEGEGKRVGEAKDEEQGEGKGAREGLRRRAGEVSGSGAAGGAGSPRGAGGE